MKNIKQSYRKFIKFFNSSISESLFKLKNKTNKFFLNRFNFLINTTLFKHGNKTNKILLNKLNFLIKTTLFKHRNKTNNILVNKFKFQVSNFNKQLILFISLLFFYLFYLLIPTLYDKTWVQNVIERKLLEETKLNFSISSEISYEILPSPHYTIKNAKILNNDINNPKELSEIKELKIFISQKKFLNKKKLKINKVLIKDANFSIQKSDLKFFNDFFNKKFNKKKIIIKNSNIFYKDKEKNTVTIVKIIKSSLYFNEIKLLNIINLKGKVFNTPFNINLNKSILSDLKNSQFNINFKKLNFNIFDESFTNSEDDLYNIEGINVFSINNSKIITNYKSKNNLILLKSKDSRIKNTTIDYGGELNLDPFHLLLDLNINKINLKNFIKPDSILFEFFKTKLLFNENISSNISLKIGKNLNQTMFDKGKIILNITNGKVNFDQSYLFDDKIGLAKVMNSELFFDNDNLIFRADLNVSINDYNKFYSTFNSPKKLRKPIKKIITNIDFNFFEDRFTINSFKIDDRQPSIELKNRLKNFNELADKSLNNIIQNRNFFNKLLSDYDG